MLLQMIHSVSKFITNIHKSTPAVFAITIEYVPASGLADLSVLRIGNCFDKPNRNLELFYHFGLVYKLSEEIELNLLLFALALAQMPSELWV